MNLLTLATRDWRANPGQSFLTVALTAIAMALLVVVLSFTRQIEGHMERDAQGIDLVVGAKGSPLQLVLSGVYHLDVPPGNVLLEDVDSLGQNPWVRRVIPLALGDSFRGFRIVGGSVAYPQLYRAELAAGVWYQEPMEAVIGSEVAERTGLLLHNEFVGSHGLTEGGHLHQDVAYTVVGIMAPTGTVMDRLIVTSVESVWWVHADHVQDDEQFDHPEVTVALIQYKSPMAAVMVPRLINSQSSLMAGSPPMEIARLMRLVGVGREALQGFAMLLFLAAGGTLLAGLLANLRVRRYELAVFRMLGARPRTLWAGVMVEAWLLATLGWLVGVVWGHGFVHLLGVWLTVNQQPSVSGLIWVTEEWWLLGLGCGVSWLAAAWPAWRASHLDVSRVLAEG